MRASSWASVGEGVVIVMALEDSEICWFVRLSQSMALTQDVAANLGDHIVMWGAMGKELEVETGRRANLRVGAGRDLPTENCSAPTPSGSARVGGVPSGMSLLTSTQPLGEGDADVRKKCRVGSSISVSEGRAEDCF